MPTFSDPFSEIAAVLAVAAAIGALAFWLKPTPYYRVHFRRYLAGSCGTELGTCP